MAKKITKTVNLSQLLNILRMVDGKRPQMISFIAVTDARLKKGKGADANPYFGTVKMSKVIGMINFNYENSVNNQLDREGNENEFKAEKRLYGVKNDESNGCLLYGANEPKLIVKVESSEKPIYMYQGKVIEKKKIEPWLPASATANRQIEVGIEKQIIYRNYDLSSLREIHIDGMELKIAI